MFVQDKDVDYINERNKVFNEKLDRNYGNYAAEIKGNIERGTALWTLELIRFVPFLFIIKINN